MFTGLIECLGEVLEVGERQGASRIAVRSSLPIEELVDGESIAVDGVCLTVAARENGCFQVDAVQETLSKTTLGELRPGAIVNLERALKAGDRLGGHLVQGHVDGTGRARAIRDVPGDHRVRFRIDDAELPRFVALKGSITVQGVSLTVAGVDGADFDVALIPETLTRTNLGTLAVGSRVNVEVDLLARYLDRLLQHRQGTADDRAPRTS